MITLHTYITYINNYIYKYYLLCKGKRRYGDVLVAVSGKQQNER